MTTILTRLEVVEQAIYDRHITVKYVPSNSPLLRGKKARPGLIKGQFYIFVDNRLSNKEKLELLLHEWGHLETHNGGRNALPHERELLAWEWAYNYYLSKDELAEMCVKYAYVENAIDIIADYYDVTPRFIIGACLHYAIVWRGEIYYGKHTED